MRLRRRSPQAEAPPPEQARMEDVDRLFPRAEQRPVRPEPREPELATAAERAAARRRLDRLADEF